VHFGTLKINKDIKFKEQAFEPIHHVQLQQNLHYKTSIMSRNECSACETYNHQGTIESL
jgi:hypothetical protein